MSKPPGYRHTESARVNCATCLYFLAIENEERGYCSLYRTIVHDHYTCNAWETAHCTHRIPNPENEAYWIGEAGIEEGSLRDYLRNQATKRPFGLPRWQAPPPEGKGPIDPALINELIDLMEALRECKKKFTKAQLRFYRRLVLARTFKRAAKRGWT